MPRNVLALLIAVALCSGAISCAKIGEPQFGARGQLPLERATKLEAIPPDYGNSSP